jgi:hypothetical protein
MLAVQRRKSVRIAIRFFLFFLTSWLINESFKSIYMDSLGFLLYNLLFYLFFFGMIFIFDFVLFFTLSKVLKFKKTDYLTALFTSFAGFASSIVLQILLDLLTGFVGKGYLYVLFQGLAFIICLFLIKYFYKENWKKTLTIGLIVFAVDLAVMFVLSFLLNLIMGQIGTTETVIQE